jgi:ABC-type multidrug transport system fused ATPase/permease subunit
VNKPSERKQGWSLLHRAWRDYVRRHLGLLVIAAVLMAVDGGSLGLISYYIKPMIDEIFIAGDKSAIYPIAGAMFLIFLARAFGAYGQRSLTSYVSLRVVSDIQRNMSKHLLSLDSAFFHRYPPGALMERVRGDSSALQSVASNALIVIGRDTFSLISLVIVAAMVDWQWTLVAFIGLPLLALPVLWLQNFIRRTTLKARIASADLSTRLDEIFHGYKAIKTNRMEDYEQQRVGDGIDAFRRQQFKSERGKAAIPSLIDIVSGLGFVAVMAYGAQQIIDGDKTLGDFMSFFAALALLFEPIRRLATLGGSLNAATVSLERLYTLFDEKPTIVDRPDAQPLAHPGGDIHFDNVTFSYGGSSYGGTRPVVNGLSFTAPAGKVTALVGPSGAGKTTIFNLLARFEEPQGGTIRIGGQALTAITLDSLRRNIAMVSQETALFDESIHHNVAYGRLDASEAEINAAAEQAQLTEYLADLPEGLNSPAGPRGCNLSGGQRQRVIIARALLRNAPILLLDEATSALDSGTETKIQAALEQVAKGRTSIVIAHRLSTIRNADMIHVVIDGQVVESGRHDELIQRNGEYARLYRQFEHAAP